jgi:hypothetical protein
MQVNITKRIDTPEGRRYCPVIISPNGRIKPDWVMVNDRQERHPESSAESFRPIGEMVLLRSAPPEMTKSIKCSPVKGMMAKILFQ